uniref:Family with sequence similarity 131 member A n=1 Tax=Astyanax mexicanus TaxID=7994 RepID=A0A8B9LSW0_ASTMX
MSLKTKTQRFSQKSEKVDEPVDMLPKSRKALSIQEIAALARSSFNGISQVVKDHVTKPTAMAQGRVAHLIEWKGWSKPFDPSSATLQSHFNSYSHLSEGEQEARFAAGVAEQFAIAEAKLRAWNSVDEEDVDEDCSEDDLPQNNDLTITTQSSGSERPGWLWVRNPGKRMERGSRCPELVPAGTPAGGRDPAAPRAGTGAGNARWIPAGSWSLQPDQRDKQHTHNQSHIKTLFMKSGPIEMLCSSTVSSVSVMFRSRVGNSFWPDIFQAITWRTTKKFCF